MRTHTLLTLALLGLLLWAPRTRADDQDAPEPEDSDEDAPKPEDSDEDAPEPEDSDEDAPEPEDTQGDSSEEDGEAEVPPKKEKTTEIEEEKDVMVLHINNFDRALSENRYLLVKFYVPWCGHCKKLEPIYAEAAAKLKEEGSEIRLAQVEATEEMELSTEFEIQGYPVLKLFMDGDRKKPIEFTGKRTSEGIIRWLERRAGPGAPLLDSADSAARFIEAHNITVIGFFHNPESEAVKVFKEVALDLADTEFALSASPEVFQKYEVKANSVVLFKKFDEGRADFPLSDDGELNPQNLTAFINQNSLELIIPFSQEMLFVRIDVSSALSNVLNYFGVSEKDAPTVRLINMETEKKFSIAADDLTLDSLRRLCQDVVAGTAKPYYRTEEIPEDWDKEPVKVLVGKNFESVATDPTKNVFVEFYAPWCGHCKELTPIWEQLAEKYADRDDIIIAKIDATANEVESLTISGFPTLKYFPADGKEVVDYTGKRDLETMSKFLDNGGVLPPAESQEEEEEDFDDEDDDTEASDIEVDGATYADENKLGDIINIKIETLLCL
uniref:protein disulfide-isomerase n=1 Tax=Gasterosteus aculeatus aculeatus TaxID=481459 RepID=G3PX45_GASAC